MGFLKNTTGLVRFSADLPEDKSLFPESIIRYSFRALEEGSDIECSIGWVDISNGEDAPIEDRVYKGEYIAMGMRVDKKSVPSSAIRPLYRKLLTERKREFPKEKITKEIRQELKATVKSTLLKKAIPSSKVYDMVWDIRKGFVWFSGTGESVVQRFVNLFKDTFNLSLNRLFPLSLAVKLGNQHPAIASCWKPDDRDAVSLIEQGKSLGRQFLTWLWYRAETLGEIDISSSKASLLFKEAPTLYLGNYVLLSNEDDLEQVSCKGENSELREAKQALAQDKLVCSINLKMSHADRDFSFSLDSTFLNFKGLKTPKTDLNKSEDLDGLFFEKVFLYSDVINVVEHLFVEFLVIRALRWPEEFENIKNWYMKEASEI